VVGGEIQGQRSLGAKPAEAEIVSKKYFGLIVRISHFAVVLFTAFHSSKAKRSTATNYLRMKK